ncbi:Mitochondrial outer membrane porin [Hordeum vulgare]|nr:Mitochondrial outer membrane porin [Hordeum vulgare]
MNEQGLDGSFCPGDRFYRDRFLTVTSFLQKTRQFRKFFAEWNNNVEDCVDALMAEATALRFGVNLARSFGCSRLIINSDNSDVIATMQDGGTFSELPAAISDDCNDIARDLSQVHYERIVRFYPLGTLV